MAFAAVISVERIIKELINSPRISLSPSCKEMMEFAYQELKSLQQILKRLDGSSKGDCRKKVNAVDARIKEAVWEFQDLIESHVDNQMLSQSDQILRYVVHLHELNPDVDDFTQKLKKMEEEYIYELDHMMPEEAPDNAVSATTDSDVRKVKLVGSSQILRAIKECCQSYTNLMIVGMAGIGKTTFCKEIFNESFKLGFERRAWVTIGRRKYPVNELEQDILVQLDPNLEKLLKAKRRLPYHTMSFEGQEMSLSGLGYPWEFMSIIGSLPRLKVLKLRCYAFRGPKWEVKDGEFKRLIYLLIEDTDLVQFKVGFGGFRLESLCLKHCYKLEDIQWNKYNFLSKIVVIDCSPSTETFANYMRSKRSIIISGEVFVHSSFKDRKLK